MTPASRPRAADVDHVRATIRTFGSRYAIVGTPRRRPRPEPIHTAPRREPDTTPKAQPTPAG